MSKNCTIETCAKPLYAKGMCGMHYQRNRKFGSPDGGIGAHHAPAEERFWRFVDVGEPQECWLWVGKFGGTYGQFQPGGKGSPHVGAHRFSFEMAYGSSPKVVMHKCDQPRCVNPAHLEAGDYKTNTADMIAKGRRGNPKALGNRNFNTKLNPNDVRAIRQRQGESAGSVGRDFGVDHGTILAIWRGITWTHID